MKTIAYSALHYGREYLGYAIKSVIDYVDEYWVLYSAIGSHGFLTNTPCPDTREELYWIAQQVAGNKLHWVDGTWAHEGLQRDSITKHCPDADVIIVLDADEVWPSTMIQQAIMRASLQMRSKMRAPMVHFWRSFYRAVLHDPAYPIRVICPKALDKPEGTLDDTYTEKQLFVAHMGYAQRPAIVEYKLLTHGHRNELRTDIDWFKERYMANAQEDCHPVGSEYWNPVSVNPWDYMPAFMENHPYSQMEVIE